MKRFMIVAAYLVCGCTAVGANELFAKYSSIVAKCFHQEAARIAPKPVDLDTAGLAVIASCRIPLDAMRKHIMTGMPNFTPSRDFWEKDMEPGYLKEARKLIATERTK